MASASLTFKWSKFDPKILPRSTFPPACQGAPDDQRLESNLLLEMNYMAHSDNAFLSRISEAIEIDAAKLQSFAPRFERAAAWFRLDCGEHNRTAPSLTVRELRQIQASARKLLKSLGIEDPEASADGPTGNILDALVLATDEDAAPIVDATRRLARLAEIVDGVAAARELAIRAQKAAEEASRVGQLTVERGNPGDRAINDWVATMMVLYRDITGREPATSVGKTGQPNEGIGAGPLIRFLAAAGEPIGLQFSEDAWRSRVRTILKGAAKQN